MKPDPVELEAALGPGVGADPAGDDDGGLLGEVVGPGEQLLADVGLRHHDLDEAGPVANDEEMDLAARAAVVQPAPEGDVLAVELGDVLDVGNGRHDQEHRIAGKQENRKTTGHREPEIGNRLSTTVTSGRPTASDDIRAGLRTTVASRAANLPMCGPAAAESGAGVPVRASAPYSSLNENASCPSSDSMRRRTAPARRNVADGPSAAAASSNMRVPS